MNKLAIYKPDTAILPGETLTETLESIGMSQKELAERMGRPDQMINEIIKGKKQITYDTAIQFERVLNIPASFWLNLEQNYRTTLARIEDEKKLMEEAGLVKNYPYLEMSKLQWVPKTTDRIEQLENLLVYFGIQSLKLVDKIEAVAFRIAQGRKISPYAMAAWLRKGELLVKGQNIDEFDKNKLENNIKKFRQMTMLLSNNFKEALVRLCAECGIYLVFVPHLKKTYVQGATRWMSPTKALIQLSLRYKYNDIFWFTFFHELAHIILHGKKEQFIDLQDADKTNVKEIEADRYATNTLVSYPKYQSFLQKNDFSRASIIDFAKSIGIAPAIVVGRLQYDRKIGFNQLNELRSKFEFVE